MSSTDKVLVYHYRGNAALQVMTVAALASKIEKSDGPLQATTKPISSSSTHVTITENDLRTPEQQAAWAGKPNGEAEMADVKIPLMVRLLGRFKVLTILSDAKVVE